MAQQHINIGTPNGQDGDFVRDAFGKVEDNFTELYARTTGSGLTDTDGIYKLGGTLTENTFLFGEGNTITFGIDLANNSNYNQYNDSRFQHDRTVFSQWDDDAGTYAEILIKDTNSTEPSISTLVNNGIGSSSIVVTPTSLLITDNINSKGLEYAADYSANYTDRSLVDKAYVDSNIGNIYTIDGTIPDGVSREVYLGIDSYLRIRSSTKNAYISLDDFDGAIRIRSTDLEGSIGLETSTAVIDMDDEGPIRINNTTHGIRLGVASNPTVGQVLSSSTTFGDLEWVDQQNIYNTNGTIPEGVLRSVTVAGTSTLSIGSAELGYIQVNPGGVIMGGAAAAEISIVGKSAFHGLKFKDNLKTEFNAYYGLNLKLGSGGAGTPPAIGDVLGASSTGGDLEWITPVTPVTTASTVINLGNYTGNYMAMASANSSTTYTTTGEVLGGFAVVLINAASEPTVTGATKIAGSTFQANTDMHMVVQYFGVTVQYYFIEI